jgi:ribonuclease HI
MAEPTIVYTDGACSGNPGPGGWAWAVPGGPFASGAAERTTNQRMELQAVLDAVTSLEGPLHVMSDSTYVVNCFRDRWWEAWLQRGWVNSQKKPVANRDLWEPLVDRVRRRRITFQWVKGHSGDRWNDLVDRLAVEAATGQSGRRGDAPPADPGPRGPRAKTRPSPEVEGHALLVVGHRPPELGGYEDNPTARALGDKLASVIAAKKQLNPDLVVVTGLSLGTETLAAEAARAVDVPYVAVLAHPGQERPWPAAATRRFLELRNGAREVKTLQSATPDTKPKLAGSYALRDGWLRRNADEAIAVWNGQDPLVGKTVRSLRDELGEENVWVIDPGELG